MQASEQPPTEIEDGSWHATPHIRPDHGGPVGRDYVPFGDLQQARPILELLDLSVHRGPLRICMDDGVRRITYSDLIADAIELACIIRTKIAEEGRVGILLAAGIEYVVAVYACLAAKRQAVLLDAAYPLASSAAIAKEAGVELLLTEGGAPSSHLTGVLSAAGTLIPTLSMRQWRAHRTVHFAAHTNPTRRELPLDIDAPAFVLCTSGSTGKPKAIMHSQRTLLHWARTAHEAFHLSSDDRVLSLSSMATLGGFTAVISVPLAGATLQMIDIKAVGFSGLLDMLTTRPVTVLRCAPSMLRAISQVPQARQALQGLRAVQTYGEPLMKVDLPAMRSVLPTTCLIRTTYGSTEASGLSGFVASTDDHDSLRVATGTLMPDTQAALVRDDGTSCEQGEIGELWIRSPYNSLGELQGGRLVRRTTPVFRTGDLARMHSDGVFVVVGRQDRMIKLNGQRIEPAEIEAVLRSFPSITEAQVILDRNAQQPRIVAFVVAAPLAMSEDALITALRAHLRAALPPFMMPARIVPIECMPLLPGGKVDTVVLQARAAGAALSVSARQ